jgi:hypothetical protein
MASDTPKSCAYRVSGSETPQSRPDQARRDRSRPGVPMIFGSPVRVLTTLIAHLDGNPGAEAPPVVWPRARARPWPAAAASETITAPVSLQACSLPLPLQKSETRRGSPVCRRSPADSRMTRRAISSTCRSVNTGSFPPCNACRSNRRTSADGEICSSTDRRLNASSSSWVMRSDKLTTNAAAVSAASTSAYSARTSAAVTASLPRCAGSEVPRSGDTLTTSMSTAVRSGQLKYGLRKSPRDPARCVARSPPRPTGTQHDRASPPTMGAAHCSTPVRPSSDR